MPYIILALGIIAALYVLYRLLIGASVAQIKTFLRNTFFILFALILLFFSMTGRLIIALALIVLAIPFVIGWFRSRSKAKSLPKPSETDDDVIENDDTDD